MINVARTNDKSSTSFSIINPLNQYKILEFLDEQNSMFICKRYSDSKQFFVKTEILLHDEKIISRKLKTFQANKEFLLNSKIEHILLPDHVLICLHPDSSIHLLLWKVFEPFEHILWNQYYTGGFKLKKKYVIRHFNETEMLLVSQALVSSLVLLFSKGKIPSFHNFFTCLSGNQYKLYFDCFDDIKDNPVLSFVDFNQQSQKLAIKKIIHKKSRMPPKELKDWEGREKKNRKSRREQMRSLKQVKLRKKTQNISRVKSLKRDEDESIQPKYKDLDSVVLNVQIGNLKKKEKQPNEYADRVQKRFDYVKERLKQNLFSSFLLNRFESLLDYTIVLIYGFLKDIVFAFYDIRVQNTEGLRKMFQQDKLDHFKNLLGLFFFMLKKKSKPSSTPNIQKKSQKNENLGKTSLNKDSDKTAISSNKPIRMTPPPPLFNTSIKELNLNKASLFNRLDHFFRVCLRVTKDFLDKEIEFPNPHWHYLRYPVFKYMKKLSLVYCGGNLQEGEIFSDLANILSNLDDLKSLSLGFSG
jgi:hypothetical protein